MLPVISWPVVLYLILFGFAHLTGGKNASAFISMDQVPFRMRVFHYGKLPVCICSLLYCVSYLLLLGARLLAGGGVVGPVLHFSGFSGPP